MVNLLLCVSCHESAVLCFGLKAEDAIKGIAFSFSFHKKLLQMPPFLTAKGLGAAVMALQKQSFLLSKFYSSFPLPGCCNNIQS